MRVTLPWPRPELSPNASRKMPAAMKRRIAREHKSDCYFAARADGATPAAAEAMLAEGRLSVSLTFHPPAGQGGRYDEDGLVARMKWGLDGLAMALGVDDNVFRLGAPVIGPRVKGGAVVVEIQP